MYNKAIVLRLPTLDYKELRKLKGNIKKEKTYEQAAACIEDLGICQPDAF